MLRDLVNIGDKIEIRQLNPRGEIMKSSLTYVSQMIDFIEYDLISIATPIKNGTLIVLEKQRDYRLYFYTIKGLFQCDCTMLQTYRENKMVLSLVKLISQPEKIQRRQYYRIECVHEIEYRLITEKEIRLHDMLTSGKYIHPDEIAELKKSLVKIENTWIHAVITDLSGGGCRFNSEQKLEAGSKIRINLNINLKNNIWKLNLAADVIASEKRIDRIAVYENRIEFTNISQKDRDILIRYIFEMERKLRKSGLK